MPTDPRSGETLDLFPADPPLLVLLRELVSGRGPHGQSSHPCPDGVTIDYLLWASGRAPEHRDVVARGMETLYRRGLVVRSDGDAPGADMWRPKGVLPL